MRMRGSKKKKKKKKNNNNNNNNNNNDDDEDEKISKIDDLLPKESPINTFLQEPVNFDKAQSYFLEKNLGEFTRETFPCHPLLNGDQLISKSNSSRSLNFITPKCSSFEIFLFVSQLEINLFQQECIEADHNVYS